MVEKLIESIKRADEVYVIFHDDKTIFESHVNTENVTLIDNVLQIGEIGSLLCICRIDEFTITESDEDWYLTDGSRSINIFSP